MPSFLTFALHGKTAQSQVENAKKSLLPTKICSPNFRTPDCSPKTGLICIPGDMDADKNLSSFFPDAAQFSI
jgi:hypothetical protein